MTKEWHFLRRTRVDCRPGQDLGHRQLCAEARGFLSREIKMPTCALCLKRDHPPLELSAHLTF